MRWVVSGVIAVHGLIHFLGFAKAFSAADLPQLRGSVSKPVGVLWWLAGVLLIATAGLLVAAPRWGWMVGLAALVLSQGLIVSAWSDAKFGTVANAVLLVAVVYGFSCHGPVSLEAQYRREVGRRLAAVSSGEAAPALVTESDLAPLPQPVRQYLRAAGAVGQPRVRHFESRWRGRIRGGPDEPWMEFTAEQHNFPGEPARFFLMRARRGGLPVTVLHTYTAQAARMRVRLLSLWPLVDAGGPQLRRAETVTLLNDLCLLAPAALLDPAVGWQPIDERSARVSYTVGENTGDENTVTAVLSFNDAGELVDFVSEDRLAASADGRQWTRQRWSTPVADYQSLGARRVMRRAEGRWQPPEGEYAYLEIELLELRID